MEGLTVKIKDIAKECNLSCATVSRALAGKSHVNSETRARIMECARTLGYSVEQHLRESRASLSSSSKKVMLIAGDIINPFYLNIIKGTGKVLAEHGIFTPIFYSDYNPLQEEACVQLALDEGYDGIVMLTAMETTSLIALLKRSMIPVVLVNRFIRSMDLDSVCIDNCRGGYLATSYLIEHGHKNIAHLAGPLNSTSSQDRLMGYKNALGDAALAYNPKRVFYGNLMRDSGVEFAEYYMKNLTDCTAVFCANDICAMGFIETLAKAGIRVPDDLSIICFDDSVAESNNIVQLTTVSRDPLSMGEVAGGLMLEAMSENHLARKIVFPPVLNERNSVRDLRQK